MAVIENTYTGNGSTTNYSFTFPYLEETDIEVTLNGVLTTAYTLANATTISFTTAPANGVAIRIYRNTDTDTLKATFFAGSAIRAQDLNNNLLQDLYAVQEAKSDAAQAPTALTNSTLALSTANSANTTASAALTAASNAVAYDPVANVAAIPGSPSNNDYIEVLDATGIESFTPLTGIPSGFVGDSGLAARLKYTTAGSTWNWVNYIANNAETRYIKNLSNTVLATNLASSSVTTAKIADSNVTTAKIADSNVTTAKLADNNVTTAKLADSSVTTVKLADSSVTAAKIAAGAAVPTGAVFYFASSTAPTGYLKANGNVVPNGSGTVQGVTADFSALYAVLGSTYGAAGTLPDLRGEFLRGWDDSRGIDTSRSFGSAQTDELKSHNHSITPSTVTGRAGGFSATAGSQPLSEETLVIGNTGGTETRPRNVALLACIKY
ncbi:MAG: phage tail fiber protein [Candidatus Nanopelagicaceae bacterium]